MLASAWPSSLSLLERRWPGGHAPSFDDLPPDIWEGLQGTAHLLLLCYSPYLFDALMI